MDAGGSDSSESSLSLKLRLLDACSDGDEIDAVATADDFDGIASRALTERVEIGASSTDGDDDDEDKDEEDKTDGDVDAFSGSVEV
jgi:hypothetical protein